MVTITEGGEPALQRDFLLGEPVEEVKVKTQHELRQEAEEKEALKSIGGVIVELEPTYNQFASQARVLTKRTRAVFEVVLYDKNLVRKLVLYKGEVTVGKSKPSRPWEDEPRLIRIMDTSEQDRFVDVSALHPSWNGLRVSTSLLYPPVLVPSKNGGGSAANYCTRCPNKHYGVGCESELFNVYPSLAQAENKVVRRLRKMKLID